jgi:hypothetical protein
MMTEREVDISEIRTSLIEVLTGGNHLASVLINRLGAGPELLPPYQTDLDSARLIVKDPETLDVWIAWRAIMRMRDRLMGIGAYE